MRGDHTRRARIAHLAPTLALLVLLVLPTHAAATEEARGVLQTVGSVTFPGASSTTTADVLGLLVPDLSPGVALHFSSGAATICFLTRQSVLVNNVQVTPPGGFNSACHDEHNVKLDSTPGTDDANSGYVGTYGGTTRTTIEAGSQVVLDSYASSKLASRGADQAEAGSDPERQPWFAIGITKPNVIATASGRVTLTGDSPIKVRGLNVHVVSDEGSSDYQTGARDSPGQRTITWLYITSRSATTVIETDGIMQVAAEQASTTASALRFHASGGTLSSTGREYAPNVGEASPDEIRGDFETTFVPDDRADRAGSLAFAGRLETTTMQRTHVPAGPFGSQSADVTALVLGVTALGGGSVAVYFHAQNRRSKLHYAQSTRQENLDEALAYFLHYADLAEEESDYTTAVAWIAAARALAPHDPGLAIDEMTYLHYAGRTLDAIRMGDQLTRREPQTSGMVDYYMAAFYMTLPEAGMQEQARIHLERALRREPSLARTIQHDADLAPLHGPEFTQMLQEALARKE